MAIQAGDVESFFELVSEAIPWFLEFGCSNYANSCCLSLAHWLTLREMKSPIVEWLKRHFKSLSEEYGETAIHTMTSLLNENNFRGHVLSDKWRETAIATSIFESFDLNKSHRQVGLKWFSAAEANAVYVSIADAFRTLYSAYLSQRHEPFCTNVSNGYTSRSERALNHSVWHKMFTSREIDFVKRNALHRGSQLLAKLQAPVRNEHYDSADLDWAC